MVDRIQRNCIFRIIRSETNITDHIYKEQLPRLKSVFGGKK